MRQLVSSIFFGVAFVGCLLWGVPWCIVGVALCATVVGIPLGMLCFTAAGAPLAALMSHRTSNQPTKADIRFARLSDELDEVIRNKPQQPNPEEFGLGTISFESEFFGNDNKE